MRVTKKLTKQIRELWRTRKAALLIVSLFAVSGSILLGTSLAEPTDEVTVSGEFIHAVQDDFELEKSKDVYTVREKAPGSDGKGGRYREVKIDRSKIKQIPRTGSQVRIRATVKDNKTEVLDQAATSIAVTAPAPAAGSTEEDSQLPTAPSEGVAQAAANKTYRRAVILMSMNVTDGSSGIDIRPVMSEATKIGMLGEASSADRFITEASYGTASLTSTVVWTAQLSITNANSCSHANLGIWADMADAYVKARGIPLDSYTHVSYILPITASTSPAAGCEWSGMGEIGGRRTWLQYGYAGVPYGATYLNGVEAHEFGHNLGLGHGSSLACTLNGVAVSISDTCTKNEYGDIYNAMGTSQNMSTSRRIFANTHRRQLGYMPASKSTLISSSGIYTLSSAGLAPAAAANPQSLRIARPNTAQQYELEYRPASGSFDNFEPGAQSTSGYLVRLINRESVVGALENQAPRLLDGTPETLTVVDGAFVYNNFVDPSGQVEIKLISRTATDLKVSVKLNGVEPPAPTGDNVAPSVTFVSPANNTPITRGTVVPLTATAKDNLGIARVEFYDSQTLLGSDTSAPYSYNWNVPTDIPATTKSVLVRAYDAAGNMTATIARQFPIVSNGEVLTPYRITAGGGAYTDPSGVAWKADAYFSGGTATTRSLTLPIAGTTNPDLYRTERTGAATYDIPIANGTYKYRLHFAETSSTCTTVGCRVFNVSGESVSILPQFDIRSVVAQNTAFVKEGAISVRDGSATFTLSAVTGTPIINGIELVSRDTAVPSISLTAPANGSSAALGSTVFIGAAASDDVGVASVTFLSDDIVLGTDTVAPFDYRWITTGQTAGSHSLQARVVDFEGRTRTSAITTINLTGTATIKPGDANGDTRVNALDLSALITHDGQNYPAADFNKDGTVGAADMAILLANWTW